MNETLTRGLIENHPRVFAIPIRSHPFYLFGFEVDDGWHDLLRACCDQIEQYLAEHPDLPFAVAQIKEKFGTLRFYFDDGDDHIQELVRQAEKQSGVTCEICGAPGTLKSLRGGGWMATRCATC